MKLAISMTIDELKEADLIGLDIVEHKMNTIWDDIPCHHCSAYKFTHEPKGFCCGDGKVMIPLPSPPDELIDLLENSTNFRNNTRAYNNALSLASLGFDKEIVNEGFSPSLKYQGTLYHLIGPLKPQDGEPQKFC